MKRIIGLKDEEAVLFKDADVLKGIVVFSIETNDFIGMVCLSQAGKPLVSFPIESQYDSPTRVTLEDLMEACPAWKFYQL